MSYIMNDKICQLLDCIDKTAYDVVQLLIDKQLKIATAESCTGGLISGAITSVSGSSAVLDEAVCTYANSAKMKYLGVKEETLREYGAVSENTASEMAVGIAQASGADIGVSVTGIAGPTGALPDKPVGTVYCGICVRGKCTARLIFTSPSGIEAESARHFIRYSTVLKALTLVREEIEKL